MHQGDCLVLEGHNGCGKSSVIRAILKVAETAQEKQTSESLERLQMDGKLELASGLKISYVSQDTSYLQGKLQDYIIQEKIDETLFKQFLRKMDFARSHFEKRMEEFSEGQKKKVLLARSLCDQAHVYIWDEPLNFIDIFSRMQLEELILKYRPTMILVEHDRTFVERVGTKIIKM